MLLEKIINDFAAENGMITGICGGGPICDEKKFHNAKTPFVKYSAEERANPRLTMPECKSIIVAGLGYKKKHAFNDDGAPRGVLSQGAIGTDYHITIKKRLAELAWNLLNYKKFNFKIFADDGPLAERELLVRAGLGWRGKNGLVISERFGSFFNAGYIMTDLEMECADKTVEPKCGSCRLCVNACPGALNGGDFEYGKCVSYLTQKKGVLTEEEKKAMGLNLYGCDACQDVCPFNESVAAEEITDIEAAKPELTGLVKITKYDFRKKYKDSAFYWRGVNNLRRNAGIALKNYYDEKSV